MRYGLVKVSALAAMGIMLLVIAACGGRPVMAPANGYTPAYTSAVSEGIADVWEGVHALYPEDGPALPQGGVMDNLGVSYRVPGMEDFHSCVLPVQFYFEYLYEDDAAAGELDAIRESLDSVDHESVEEDRTFLSGRIGEYSINISLSVKDGPDSMHYSVEMPETHVDAEAFVKKVRTGPISGMIYRPLHDVEYSRNVFENYEQWVWGYLTKACLKETINWYEKQAESEGYAGVHREELEWGATEIHAPGAGDQDTWTAQIQKTESGFIQVWFSLIHED